MFSGRTWVSQAIQTTDLERHLLRDQYSLTDIFKLAKKESLSRGEKKKLQKHDLVQVQSQRSEVRSSNYQMDGNERFFHSSWNSGGFAGRRHNCIYLGKL